MTQRGGGRGDSTAADVFDFVSLFSILFFCFLPTWVDKCAWCLFLKKSLCLKEKEKRARSKNIKLLCFIHFMLEAVEALLRQEGLLHVNTLIGTRRSRGKGQQAVIGDYFLSGRISGNFWDHNAS